MKKNYDVIIIGGGPGGYVAAIRACQLGLRTALIEEKHWGGVCLHWGCIPTKALLKSSSFFHAAHTLGQFGVSVENIVAEITTMVQRSRAVSHQLSQGLQGLLQKNGMDLFQARGQIQKRSGPDYKILLSNQQTLQSPNIILATGARPRSIFSPDLGLWSYREAMMPEKIPTSLLIVGAGAIGIEFASFYSALGTKVTVVEQAKTILALEDEEIRDLAYKSFVKEGIHFHLSCTIERVEKISHGSASGSFAVKIRSKEGKIEDWQGEKVLLAIGVIGNTENLGLEHTKVRVKDGHIVVHGTGQTEEQGMYAIGDVAGPPWLAHKASHEGVICVESIAGRPSHPLDPMQIPGCVYSAPQIASIGLTEHQAKEKGIPIRVGRSPFVANGQALAQGETTGLVKVLFHETTGELLGAHMVGYNVSELIQGFSIAKALEATDEALQRVIFPHPTLSEVMHEAILDACGQSIHYFRDCIRNEITK